MTGRVALDSDVRVTSATVGFKPVPFATPLHLSSGAIRELTEARVHVKVERRDGRKATGLGSVLLSYPWAGGTDAAMRSAVGHLTNLATTLGYGDPLMLGTRLLDALPRLALPRLAAEVALGPVDQAVHDAWAHAAGRSAYRMYTAEFLVHDLGAYLGPDFANRWPSEWFARFPARRLPIQYVLGVDEPAENGEGRDWIKVKLCGSVDADLARVRDIAAPGRTLSLDPNEAYTCVADLHRLLSSVDSECVRYVEQPVPRGERGPGPAPIPVLADEGLPDPRHLDTLNGWDGIVVKTCRGQTAALLAYCWALHRGRFVVQQDLTHVGPALAHAAAFAAHCSYSVRAFECNSLKFAPAGNAEIAVERPGLVIEHDGLIETSVQGVGIR
jgi:L-alanine-DL-glutamate epimerase-like enolase superfamily enzyme